MKDSVKYVRCTFCEWVKTYIDPREKESAWLAANEHALMCEHDPRNSELAALRAEVAGLKAENAQPLECPFCETRRLLELVANIVDKIPTIGAEFYDEDIVEIANNVENAKSTFRCYCE